VSPSDSGGAHFVGVAPIGRAADFWLPSKTGGLRWAVKNPGLTQLFDCANYVPRFFLSPRASLSGTSERFGVRSGCDDDGPPRLACPTGRRSFACETWLPARQAGHGSDGVYDCMVIPNSAFLPDKLARGRKENTTFSPQKILGQYQVFNGPGLRPAADKISRHAAAFGCSACFASTAFRTVLSARRYPLV